MHIFMKKVSFFPLISRMLCHLYNEACFNKCFEIIIFFVPFTTNAIIIILLLSDTICSPPCKDEEDVFTVHSRCSRCYNANIPLLSLMKRLAPASKSISITFTCSCITARCSGVRPSESCSFNSTSYCKSNSTT